MVTISLCMIVKNEEQILARCLDSIADLMDEIIIVDTGSTDRTKEIARAYTSQIFDYEWKDDFADARNYSFSKATKDYIYCADADEVLDEMNRQRFLALKQVLEGEADVVQMYYCNQLQYNTVYNYDREYRPKLYKRLRTFRFEDPIHEMVRLDPIVYDSDIEIMHMPAAPHGARDIRNFEKMIREGKRVSKRLHGMYAKELFIAGREEDFARAKVFFLGSVEDESRSMEELQQAFCVLARAARLEGDLDTFFKYTMRSVASEGCAEICCELGDYYSGKSDYAEAAMWYSNAAYETECILNRKYQEVYPLERLMECYEAFGNTEAAAQVREQLEENKRRMKQEGAYKDSMEA